MTDPIARTEANDLPPSPRQVLDETMSRWGDDGGTVPLPADAGKAAAPDTAADNGQEHAPDLGCDLVNAELVTLRVRVIALENLLVALLAAVSPGQLAKVRTMADNIPPRSGSQPHQLAICAASNMLSLLHHAEQLAGPWSGSDQQVSEN